MNKSIEKEKFLEKRFIYDKSGRQGMRHFTQHNPAAGGQGAAYVGLLRQEKRLPLLRYSQYIQDTADKGVSGNGTAI